MNGVLAATNLPRQRHPHRHQCLGGIAHLLEALVRSNDNCQQQVLSIVAGGGNGLYGWTLTNYGTVT